MNWWDNFWKWADTSQLGSNVVGGTLSGLAVAAVVFVLSLLVKSWRIATWGRAVSWLKRFPYRVVHKRNAQSARGLQAQLYQKNLVLHGRAQELTAAQAAIEDLQDEASGQRAEVAALKQRIGELKEERDAIALEKDEALSVATKAVEKLADSRPSALPLPRPRWSVYPDPDAAAYDAWVLRNAMPRSVAREVHIEGDSDFAVTDAGHWEQLSGDTVGDFFGDINQRGLALGVRFIVTWYDEHGDPQEASVNLRPLEPGSLDPSDSPF